MSFRLKIKYFSKILSVGKGNGMAKGKKCPQCGAYMQAISEDEQPKGNWVVYECLNGDCKFREKIFESK